MGAERGLLRQKVFVFGEKDGEGKVSFVVDDRAWLHAAGGAFTAIGAAEATCQQNGTGDAVAIAAKESLGFAMFLAAF